MNTISRKNLIKIRNTISFFSIIVIIVIILLISLFILHILPERLLKQEELRLISLMKDREKTVENYISKYTYMAKQIASQAEIRDMLIFYYSGKISSIKLREFFISKLKNIIFLSPEIRGITIFSKKSKLLLSMGEMLPEQYLKKKIILIKNTIISELLRKNENWYITIFVPIMDEKGNNLGIEAVLMDFSDIVSLIERRIKPLPYVKFVFGELKNGKIEFFLCEEKNSCPSFREVIPIFAKSFKKIAEIEKNTLLFIYTPIKNTNWFLLLKMDKIIARETILQPIRSLLFVMITIIILVLFGTLLFFLRIIKKALVKTIELENEVSAKSLQLAEEMQKRENLEELYEININFLAAVLDTIPIPIVAKDIKTEEYIFVNKAFTEVARKSIDEIIGKTPYELWDRDTAEALKKADKEVEENMRELICEFEFRKSLNERVYGILTKAPFFNGKGDLVGIVSAFLDLTEKKKLEKELSRLASVVEQASEYIIITDAKGSIIYVNAAFTEVTGYERDEVIGKNPRILQSGKHSKEFYKEFWDTIKSGNVWRGEFINRKKNGSEYYDYTVAFPIRDRNGEIINFAAIKRDVTEERIKERRFQQIQKMDTIGRLVGGIAHDFNNQLTVILGYAELILQEAKEHSNIYSRAEKIKVTGEKARELTKQLLAFGKRQVFAPKVLDLNNFLYETLDLMERLVPEDIEILIVPSPKPLFIYADPIQLEQIIMNLVVNSKDALLEKENRLNKSYKKTIIIETDKVYLDNSYVGVHPGSRIGEFVVIAVSDNGIGMNEETVEKIFEPFFTTKEKDKGTGLGLSTIYGIVKQNNGIIYVYSEPFKGTTFKIYWPSTVEPPKEVKEKEREEVNKFKGNESIMVVEDNKEVRGFIKESLISLGYKVYEAKNGKEALKMIIEKKIAPHVVITDVIMPEMNGEELALRIKKIIPQVKILFTSGYAYAHIIRNEMLKKEIDFLQKPFSIVRLARKIRTILNKE